MCQLISLFFNCAHAFIKLALGMELRHREHELLAYATCLQGAVLMSEPGLFDSTKLFVTLDKSLKFVSNCLELRQMSITKLAI